METCPNCGAVARPGAKFCTTCGTRLGGLTTPVAETTSIFTPAASVASTPEPSETTAPTDSWSWGTPSSAPEPAAKPEAPAGETPAEPEDAPSWNWAAPAQDAATEPGDADTSSALVDAPAFPLDDDEEAAQLSSWAARWNAETGTWRESTSDSTPASTEEGIEGAPAGMVLTDASLPEEEAPTLPDTGAIELPAEEPGDPAFVGIEGAPAGDPEALVVAEEIATEDAPAETPPADIAEAAMETPESDVIEIADVADVEAVAEETPEPDVFAPVAVAETPAPNPVAEPVAAVTGGDVQVRAASLLDELRALLPQLTAATATGEGVNPAAVLAPLQGALGERVNYDALRAIVTQAEASPRDLYAMMDLGRHTGEILALLDERDRLRAAIDAALTAGDTSES
ncbi:MAG: zinc ribbon domain-containing protein [Thermomicrobiales bacterium]